MLSSGPVIRRDRAFRVLLESYEKTDLPARQVASVPTPRHLHYPENTLKIELVALIYGWIRARLACANGYRRRDCTGTAILSLPSSVNRSMVALPHTAHIHLPRHETERSCRAHFLADPEWLNGNTEGQPSSDTGNH